MVICLNLGQIICT